jgi:phosphoheptose isomerase
MVYKETSNIISKEHSMKKLKEGSEQAVKNVVNANDSVFSSFCKETAVILCKKQGQQTSKYKATFFSAKK